MQRLKSVVAVMLALMWLPAVSCCWIDASGLLGHQDCCAKEHSSQSPAPTGCDQPCGVLASSTYFSQQNQIAFIPPPALALFTLTDLLVVIEPPVRIWHNFPATAPPELAGHWQFSFRTALSPRSPSFVS